MAMAAGIDDTGDTGDMDEGEAIHLLKSGCLECGRGEFSGYCAHWRGSLS